MIGSSGCPLFTPDDAWNVDISGAAVDATQTSVVAAAVGTIKIHPDFGPGFGIPFNVVPSSQKAVPVTFDTYADESDPGPYPLPDPSVARVEGTDDPHSCDGDCHFLAVQMGTCMLYQGYACHYDNAKGWICSNGAKWDLKKKSYGQRPEGWTSVDAAGLPVYAGLARYEELTAGEIPHALRFTMSKTAAKHIAPATHDAGSDTTAPPMGLRVRLKASYDASALAPEAQVFVRAMKEYGMILADNGSNFYFQFGDPALEIEVAAVVGQDHAVLLHRANEDLRLRRQRAGVVAGLEAHAQAHRRRGGAAARVVSRWRDVLGGSLAHREAQCVSDLARGQLFVAREARVEGRPAASADVQPSGRWP